MIDRLEAALYRLADGLVENWATTCVLVTLGLLWLIWAVAR